MRSLGGKTRRLLRVREREITSSGIALLFALSLSLFVLGRGPGTLVWIAGGDSNLRWLPFAGAGVSWLPFNQQVSWLPYKAAMSSPPAGTPAPVAAVPAPTPHQAGAPPTAPPNHPTPPPATNPPGTPTPAPTPTAPPPPTPPLILFSDDFTGDPLGASVAGWTHVNPAWSIVNDGGNVLRGNGTNAVICTGSSGCGNPAWATSNYSVSALVKPTAGGQALILARYQDASNYYACGFDSSGNLIAGKRRAGSWTALGAPVPFNHTSWVTVTLSVRRSAGVDTINCSAAPSVGAPVSVPPQTARDFGAGQIAANTTGSAEFDQFVVTRLG